MTIGIDGWGGVNDESELWENERYRQMITEDNDQYFRYWGRTLKIRMGR